VVPAQPRAISPGLGRAWAGRAPSGLRSTSVDPMPQPGEPCPGFVAGPGRCWRMLYSGQAVEEGCHERPAWTGRWFSPRGDRWFRVWACLDHLDGLTGLRQFGSRREP